MERGGIAAGASRAGLFSPRSGGKGVLRLGFGGLFLPFDTAHQRGRVEVEDVLRG